MNTYLLSGWTITVEVSLFATTVALLVTAVLSCEVSTSASEARATESSRKWSVLMGVRPVARTERRWSTSPIWEAEWSGPLEMIRCRKHLQLLSFKLCFFPPLLLLLEHLGQVRVVVFSRLFPGHLIGRLVVVLSPHLKHEQTIAERFFGLANVLQNAIGSILIFSAQFCCQLHKLQDSILRGLEHLLNRFQLLKEIL